jgi:asparagine synthase (glutamine-hydrolysing)
VSALAGIYDRGGAVDPATLAAMLAAMAPRAPDGSAVWHDGPVGLGHGLLRSVPEDQRLPLEQGGLVITADARLDNRADLAAAVGLDLRTGAKASDASLILEAYRTWGERCPEYLLGDFAFLLWDRRRRALFAARDHFGIKPFYYHHEAEAFCCASEIKALFAVPGVPRRLDEIRLADFLARDIDDPATTLFQDIRRLPARHSLTVTADGRLRTRQYWRPDLPNELRLRSDADYAERFLELFEAAVRCRLRSDRPIGAMLSGGLDSSSIVCVARNALQNKQSPRLLTFSHVFDRTPQCTERPFIERVVAQGGIDPHFIAADDHAPFDNFIDILHDQDEIFIAPGMSRSYSLYNAAATCGLRALLDGQGGDEVVSQGFAYLHELALGGRWVKLWRELGGVSRIYGESSLGNWWYFAGRYALARQRSRYRLLDRLWRAPNKLRRLWLQIRRDRPDPITWRQFISDDFIRRTGVLERKRHALEAYARALRSERTEHFFAMSSALLPRGLEILDRAAAAAGIEPRYPFYDKRLVEFCLALPAEQKLRDGWGRLVLRRAMAGVLPPEIQWRRDKLDFTPHLVAGMLTHHRALIDEILETDVGGLGRYMNLSALRQAYGRLVMQGARVRGHEAHALWLAVALALWLRRLDEPPVASAPLRLVSAPVHA